MTGDAGRLAQTYPPYFTRAHQALMRRHDLQLGFPQRQVPPTPQWLIDFLHAFGRLVRAIAPALKIFFWVAVAAAVLAAAYVIARPLLERVGWRRRRAAAARTPAAEDWRPTAARARTLLEEADRLAEEGRYDEAARLILFRSIEDIDRRWPNLVRPALTSRDIAAHTALPDAARATFFGIAQVVERSLFGGRRLEAADFAACRRAYSDFALPGTA